MVAIYLLDNEHFRQSLGIIRQTLPIYINLYATINVSHSVILIYYSIHIMHNYKSYVGVIIGVSSENSILF